jgi:hypothetical protein
LLLLLGGEDHRVREIDYAPRDAEPSCKVRRQATEVGFCAREAAESNRQSQQATRRTKAALMLDRRHRTDSVADLGIFVAKLLVMEKSIACAEHFCFKIAMGVLGLEARAPDGRTAKASKQAKIHTWCF